jgi:hypothetical protein
MKELIEKLIEVEKRTSQEKGEYDLFALFLREESSNKWDVVVSSKWISQDKPGGLKYLSNKINEVLNKEELISISHIAIIDEAGNKLSKVQQAINVEHGSLEIRESNFFGLQIKRGFLITSRNNQAA